MGERKRSTPAHLTRLLGIRHPLIQAPMGGGPTTPALVTAVAEAGGLGSVAAGYLDPEQLRQEIAEVRRRTRAPFAVNVFAGGATDGAADPSEMMTVLARWHTAYGIEPPRLPHPRQDVLEAQVEVVLETDVPAFSFTFGIPPDGILGEMKARGVVTLGTATTVREARMLEAAGTDVVVAQGSEAGAHRGTFADPFEAAMVGGLALVPQIVDAVDVPVVASGGIMDGRGIVAAWALGAAGVQLGTAFLTTEEAGTTGVHRRRLLEAAGEETALTRAFSGRPARGIRNRFMDEVERLGVAIPPYPMQNDLTRQLRKVAAEAEEDGAVSLWAGQGVGMARALSARELVSTLMEEAAATVKTLSEFSTS